MVLPRHGIYHYQVRGMQMKMVSLELNIDWVTHGYCRTLGAVCIHY